MIYRRSCKKCEQYNAEHARDIRVEGADAPMDCQQCRRFFPDMFRLKVSKE